MPDELLVRNVKSVDAVLKNIDWSFYPKPKTSVGTAAPFNSRKYHWFPATFVPEIPYTLIELLTKPMARVFDPFLGIGTTYFQALLLNRIPYGADICRIATDYTENTLTLFDPLFDINVIIESVKARIDTFNSERNYYDILRNVSDNPYIEELKRWYSEHNWNFLCFLKYAEVTEVERHIRASMKVTLSSLLSSVSNQDRGWGCIADNVIPKSYQVRNVDVKRLFMQRISCLIRDIDRLKQLRDDNSVAIFKELSKNKTIFHTDVTSIQEIPDETIDLVLTSPPYPNMVDYVTSQRLSYYCNGYDLQKDKRLEIGARYKRFGNHSLDDYRKRMNAANQKVSRLIKKGGLLCYIMPLFNSDNENNHSRRSLVQKVIAELGEMNLVKETDLERSMPRLRRSHNATWATLQKEIIHVYKKI